MPRYLEISIKALAILAILGPLLIKADPSRDNLDQAHNLDRTNKIIDKAHIEASAIRNEHIEMIDSFLLTFQNLVDPIYDQAENIADNLFVQIKSKLWLKIPFLLVILAIVFGYVKSMLGFSSGSQSGAINVVYNKEEPLTLADIKQHFINFGKDLTTFKQKFDSIPSNGSAVSASKTSANPQSNVNSDEMKRKIQNITQSINKNEEALDKFHKEKKNIDVFLFDFQKEVIDSQTAIWKELHNVKNILSGKPATINPVTPKQKEKPNDRSGSSLSNEIEKNSPETTRNIESNFRPESHRAKEEPESFRNENIIAHHQQQQQHTKTKSQDEGSSLSDEQQKKDIPPANNIQFPQKLQPSNYQNTKLPEKQIISQQPENASVSSSSSQLDLGKRETRQETKTETLNTEESQPEKQEVEEKREVSPFNRTMPAVGFKPPFKPGMNTKMPIPAVRKTGPVIGANPFNKPTIPKTNTQGEGA